MAYRLKVERRAFKQLQKFPQPHRRRVTKAILSLEENPFPPGKKWKPYLKNSTTDKCLDILLGAGYRLFITSDHGNVDAVGTGVRSPKALVETYAKRVIIFDRQSSR